MADRQAYLDGKISHDDYYLQVAKEHHIALNKNDLSSFGVRSLSHLRDLLQEDENLNSIPLSVFDGLTVSYNMYNPQSRLTPAEGTCVYKALLKELAMSSAGEHSRRRNNRKSKSKRKSSPRTGIRGLR